MRPSNSWKCRPGLLSFFWLWSPYRRSIPSSFSLLECSASVRAFRLTELRQQPELAYARMERWAVYLRDQADAMGLPVIQTDNLTLDEVPAAVEAEVLDQGLVGAL